MFAVFIKWQVCMQCSHDCHSQMYDNMHALQVGCGLTQNYNYLITHNVSSDQSPITVNRTNVTLYGVQPGETYTVEIMPYVTQSSSATMSYFATVTVKIKSPVCNVICQRGKQLTVASLFMSHKILLLRIQYHTLLQLQLHI